MRDIPEPTWIESQNRWRVRVQKDGVRKSFYSSRAGRYGKAECRTKAEAWLNGESEGDTKTKVRYVIAEWIEHEKKATSRSSWRQRETIANNYLIPAIGNLKMEALREPHFQRIIYSAASKGAKGNPLSEKSLKNIRGAITSFCKFARKVKGYSVRVDDLEIPHNAPKSHKTVLPPDAVRKVFQCNQTTWRNNVRDDFYVNSYRLAIVTGLRPGELLALTRGSVVGNRLIVSRSFNDLHEYTEGKNANAKRTIILGPITLGIIENQLAMLSDRGIAGDLLFPNEEGEQVTQKTWRKSWYRYCTYNDIPQCTPYEFRHTYVSINKNLPEGLLRGLVGHSKNMDTFGTYGHEFGDDAAKAAALVEENLSALINEL